MGAPDPATLAAIFKAYDVRGTVGDQLDAELVERIGAAFAAFVAADPETSGRVLVGRDMRPSGVELSQAFARGVMSQGLDVVDLGLVSTDLLFFASGRYDAPGATLTASHNPAAYNGIKMCLTGARPIGEDTGLGDIRQMTLDGLAPGRPAGHGQHPRRPGRLRGPRPQLRGSRRAGAAARSWPTPPTAWAVWWRRPCSPGCRSSSRCSTASWTAPSPTTRPIPSSPRTWSTSRPGCWRPGADVGLAFDGDADRVFLVDDQGQLVSGSLTTAIVAAELLRKYPGATILHNLICSKAVPEVIREHGGTPVRTRVGHSLIKAVMAETGAAFGGEHSGHYYFRDNFRADSGIIAAMVVLDALSRRRVSLSELRKPYERYVDSGEINTKVGDPAAVIERVAAHYPDAAQDRLDGLTVDLGDWWFNLRPSNTEPLLRLNLEAPDRAACDDHVAEVRLLIAEADAAAPADPQGSA